jgi:hypothetical protein
MSEGKIITLTDSSDLEPEEFGQNAIGVQIIKFRTSRNQSFRETVSRQICSRHCIGQASRDEVARKDFEQIIAEPPFESMVKTSNDWWVSRGIDICLLP